MRHKLNALLLLFVLLLFATAVPAQRKSGSVKPSQANGKRPNIIVILADDMGFSDVGAYGGEIRTPNLDRLAQRGLRFTQFYNTARCCPSRASLLTGLYPHQAGIGHMTDDYAREIRARLNSPAYSTYLNDTSVTIAEALRQNGYHTLMSGKWHVGEERPHHPVDRGFERSFALITGASNYFALPGRWQGTWAIDDQPYTPPADGSFYSTDAFTDHAVLMVDEYARKDKPFFLYLAYTAPHWPLHAFASDIAKYRGKYLKGWDAVRAARYRRQLELGIIRRSRQSAPRDERVPAWEEASTLTAWTQPLNALPRNAERFGYKPGTYDPTDKQMWDLKMAIYAAQIDRMDQGIGRVLAKLKETGAEENTLILFLSDNGAADERIYEGQADAPIGAPASFQSYDVPWANVSSTPFRLYKHFSHEGGIATPLIAYYPALIKRARLVHQPGHLIDIMATCLDAAGAEYPRTYKGKKITPLEGVSLLPLMKGQRYVGRKEIYFEHEGNRAVRQGRWKSVSRFPGGWQLYDMETDRTELTDIASRYPEKVKELAGLYEAWERRVGVVPWERAVAK